MAILMDKLGHRLKKTESKKWGRTQPPSKQTSKSQVPPGELDTQASTDQQQQQQQSQKLRSSQAGGEEVGGRVNADVQVCIIR